MRAQYIQPPKGSLSGMPSASTSARLAPLAPSPRNDTPCDVGLAVWLPDRRNSEKPATLRNLSSVASAPHCCNCVEVTATASGCASTSSTSVGRMAVRVAVTSRLCCTAAGTSVMENWLPPACHAVVLVAKPDAFTTRVPLVAVIPVNTKLPSAWVVRLSSCPSTRSRTWALAITAPLRSFTTPRNSCSGAAQRLNCVMWKTTATTAAIVRRRERNIRVSSHTEAVIVEIQHMDEYWRSISREAGHDPGLCRVAHSVDGRLPCPQRASYKSWKEHTVTCVLPRDVRLSLLLVVLRGPRSC